MRSPTSLRGRRAAVRSSPAGDAILVTQRVYDAGGARIGDAFSDCVMVKSSRSPKKTTFRCDATYVLRDGSIVVSAATRGDNPNVTSAVIGGTGAYEGARGSITSVERRDGVSHDTVHLLP